MACSNKDPGGREGNCIMLQLNLPQYSLEALTSSIRQWMNSMCWSCHIFPVLSLFLKVHPHTLLTTYIDSKNKGINFIINYLS